MAGLPAWPVQCLRGMTEFDSLFCKSYQVATFLHMGKSIRPWGGTPWLCDRRPHRQSAKQTSDVRSFLTRVGEIIWSVIARWLHLVFDLLAIVNLSQVLRRIYVLPAKLTRVNFGPPSAARSVLFRLAGCYVKAAVIGTGARTSGRLQGCEGTSRARIVQRISAACSANANTAWIAWPIGAVVIETGQVQRCWSGRILPDAALASDQSGGSLPPLPASDNLSYVVFMGKTI